MKNRIVFAMIICALTSKAQQSVNITFPHTDKTVYGVFSKPAGNGPFETIILAPGSGAVDKDGTITMSGGNVACLYPSLLGTTLKPYKQLGDALVAAGYAVLRYNKLEYNYSA